MRGDQNHGTPPDGHKLARPRILIVGCGDVGLRIAQLLSPRYALFGTTRQHSQFERLRNAGVRPIHADLDDPNSLWRLRGLARSVIHLAPPPLSGRHDTRTRHLVCALGRVQRLVYISTSGVYGDCGGALIDETHWPRPESERGMRRLDAERTLRHWARQSGAQLSILRVPGIYAGERLPIARIKSRTPALLEEEDVYTNHIHADDLARISVAALQRGAPQRVYHASDDSRLRMGDYFDLVADHFALERAPRVGRALLAARVSEASYSFMRESRRLDNTRLKAELAVTLHYPEVRDGLRALTPPCVEVTARG